MQMDDVAAAERLYSTNLETASRVAMPRRFRITEQIENLVLEYLRAMRSDISSIQLDLQGLRVRVASLETLVANAVSGVPGLHGRLDAMDRRMERIESRLELAP